MAMAHASAKRGEAAFWEINTTQDPNLGPTIETATAREVTRPRPPPEGVRLVRAHVLQGTQLWVGLDLGATTISAVLVDDQVRGSIPSSIPRSAPFRRLCSLRRATSSRTRTRSCAVAT